METKFLNLKLRFLIINSGFILKTRWPLSAATDKSQKTHQNFVVSCLEFFCTPIRQQVLILVLASHRHLD